MTLDISLKISNYKCFGEVPQGFERILPINIIIGKNNSGKSSLLDIVKHISLASKSPISTSYTTKLTLSTILTDQFLSEFEENTKIIFKHDPRIDNNYHQNKKFILNSICEYSLKRISTSDDFEIENAIFNFPPDVAPRNETLDLISYRLPKPLYKKKLRIIDAERDIKAENKNDQMDAESDGRFATNIISQIFTLSKLNTKIITHDLLNELNRIINPDIKFKEIIPQNHDDGLWEIFFQDEYDNIIPLSKMGSGIKTILLVLINTIVIPKLNNTNESKYVFVFEELENNLHPSLLRRLFNYIAEYSIRHQSYFFITTHSSIVIDMFSSNPNAQILHTQKVGAETIVKTVSSATDNLEILKDIDVRASDLLLSNGIIWVEGPSDRVFINKWLQLLAPELKEGLHYSIMFYGGRLLSNLAFDHDALEKELIPLLKINHNAHVVIDRDAKSISSELNQTKQRIEKEIGTDNCWITEGREIENYLSKTTIETWLKDKHTTTASIKEDQYSKIQDTLTAADADIQYDKDKKGYSLEIVNYITKDDLENYDLKSQLFKLIANIKEWNSLA